MFLKVANFDAAPPDSLLNHATRANRVCEHIDDLIGTLHRLHRENAFWKSKYLHAKKQDFMTYFSETSTGLLKLAVQNWRAVTAEAQMQRNVSY
jgi:hypothetical protein